jgi:hypothetical protein
MANYLAKSVSDNTEFELCRVKHLLGKYLDPASEYIPAEALIVFNP